MDEYTLEKLAAYFDEDEIDAIFEGDYIGDGMDKTAAYEEELGAVMGLGYNDEMEKIAALIDGDPAAEYYEAGREIALEELGLEKEAASASTLLDMLGSKIGAGAGAGAKSIAALAAKYPTLSAAAHGAVPFGAPAAVGAGLLLGRKHIGRAIKGMKKSFRNGVLLNNRLTGKVLSPARKARDAARSLRRRNLATAGAIGLGGGLVGGHYGRSKKASDVESVKNAIKMAILNGQG